MKLSEAVAERLKQLMAERKLNQYKLFKITGVSQTTLYNQFKQKDATCKLITLSQICEGLEIGLKEFFDSSLFTYDNIQNE